MTTETKKINFSSFYILILFLNSIILFEKNGIAPIAIMYLLPYLSIESLLTGYNFIFILLLMISIISFFLTKRKTLHFKIIPFIIIIINWLIAFSITQNIELTFTSGLPFLIVLVIFITKYIKAYHRQQDNAEHTLPTS
jgi:hypothetical protein